LEMGLTFNSFEDETAEAPMFKRRYTSDFQFLWGWNNSIIHIQNAYLYFQFLWGWNKLKESQSLRLFIFQFLWGWNLALIPRARWFFGDRNFQFLWGWNVVATIRRKGYYKVFQFYPRSTLSASHK